MVEAPNENSPDSALPEIVLDSVELMACCGASVERLSEVEFLLLEQFIRFPEKPLQTESLLETIAAHGDSQGTFTDTEKKLKKLIATVNALYPAYPLVRRLSRDTWIYSVVRPPKKKR